MVVGKCTFDLVTIELTEEEIKQCGLIKTDKGVIRIMPPSVMKKIEDAKLEAIKSMRWEKSD